MEIIWFANLYQQKHVRGILILKARYVQGHDIVDHIVDDIHRGYLNMLIAGLNAGSIRTRIHLGSGSVPEHLGVCAPRTLAEIIRVTQEYEERNAEDL